jgi:hypothetical protein
MTGLGRMTSMIALDYLHEAVMGISTLSELPMTIDAFALALKQFPWLF